MNIKVQDPEPDPDLEEFLNSIFDEEQETEDQEELDFLIDYINGESDD